MSVSVELERFVYWQGIAGRLVRHDRQLEMPIETNVKVYKVSIDLFFFSPRFETIANDMDR